MSEFVMPTHGLVPSPDGGPDGRAGYRWNDLDSFTQGYIEAMFFTDTCHDYDREEWDTPTAIENVREGRVSGSIPSDAAFGDIAPSFLAKIIEDCTKFQETDAWKAMDAVATSMDNAASDLPFPDDAQAGRDFWYTRNGHGCGFWDGDWPEPHGMALLTEASKAFGEVDIYWNDNGQVDG